MSFYNHRKENSKKREYYKIHQKKKYTVFLSVYLGIWG